MKRLLLIIALCFSLSAQCMHRVLHSTKKTNPRNMHVCLNTPRNFGTTHFIVGYKNPDILPIQIKEKKQKNFDERPLIINGSSAHLIDETRLTQSFFTTKHDISSIILSVLAQAKRKIRIAAFSLTDSRIANQLIAAHKKGIDVCIIMDAGNMKNNYSKAQKLIENGISVWRYEPSLPWLSLRNASSCCFSTSDTT